jgi:hypothetical protein
VRSLLVAGAAIVAAIVWWLRRDPIHHFDNAEDAIDWLTDGVGIPEDPYLVGYPIGGMTI